MSHIPSTDSESESDISYLANASSTSRMAVASSVLCVHASSSSSMEWRIITSLVYAHYALLFTQKYNVVMHMIRLTRTAL